MRRLVAALIVVTLALVLAGCGGGGEEQAATPTSGESVAPPPPAGSQVAAVTDKSPDEGQDYTALPTDEDIVPTAVLERLKTKQPMVIYFYDATQRSTNDQDAQLETVMKANRGLIDLVKYDIGKFASIDASGATRADASISATANAESERATLFADQLKISFAPYLLLVDSDGYIVWRFRGYTDAKLIEQQVVRATK